MENQKEQLMKHLNNVYILAEKAETTKQNHIVVEYSYKTLKEFIEKLNIIEHEKTENEKD